MAAQHTVKQMYGEAVARDMASLITLTDTVSGRRRPF
jgi:hypothetical protein